MRIHLKIADPARRKRIGELLAKDPDIVLVGDPDQADLVVAEPAGRAMPAIVSDAGAALTPRELEVLRLMAEGVGNKGIGAALGISTHTAKYHVASVLAKLDVQSRTEAVTRGMREGLLPL